MHHENACCIKPTKKKGEEIVATTGTCFPINTPAHCRKVGVCFFFFFFNEYMETEWLEPQEHGRLQLQLHKISLRHPLQLNHFITSCEIGCSLLVSNDKNYFAEKCSRFLKNVAALKTQFVHVNMQIQLLNCLRACISI